MCVTWRLIGRSDVARVRCHWNTHELELVVECLPAEEDDVEGMEMPGDELRDGPEGEEQEPMEDGEQRDGSVAEHAGHSKRDLGRESKHGRASELAIQEARRMRCDVGLKTCNQNFHVLRFLVKCWKLLGLDILSLPHWEGFTKSVQCLNIVCHGTC